MEHNDGDLSVERSAFNVDDDAFDLFMAALLIGRIADPDVELEEARATVDHLTDDVTRAIAREDEHAQITALLEVFFGKWGFKGDVIEYDAPDNSFIHCVLQRRRGLPIALAIVFCEVARRIGVDAYGISFPGHFLVGLNFSTEHGGRDLKVIDPFHGGRIRRAHDLKTHLKRLAGRDVPLTPEHLAPASPRTVLERLLNNLRASYARRTLIAPLVRVHSRLLILRRNHAGLHLERARARRMLLDYEGATADARLAAAHSQGDVNLMAKELLTLLDSDQGEFH